MVIAGIAQKRQQPPSISGKKKKIEMLGTLVALSRSIIVSWIPDTQQPPLAQNCGSLKPLSLWNVPDFVRNKELFGGRQWRWFANLPQEWSAIHTALHLIKCFSVEMRYEFLRFNPTAKHSQFTPKWICKTNVFLYRMLPYGTYSVYSVLLHFE